MLCGLAWNIDSMIVFRALQGLLGASMIPTVFTSSFHYFEGPRRVYAAAVVGTIASIAPTLGPVIGGWITDTLDWHWLFYINLLPGLLVALGVALLVDIDKPDLSLLRRRRLSRHRADGDRSRHAGIRAGGRRALELVRATRPSAPARSSPRSPASCSSSAA